MKIVEILKDMFFGIRHGNFVNTQYCRNISEEDRLYIGRKLAEQNVQRIVPLCFIIILFQLMNLVVDSIRNPYGSEKIYCMIATIFLIVFPLFFLWFINRLLSSENKSVRKITSTYRVFWVLLGFVLTALSIKDIIVFGFPLNSLLFCGLLTLVPILSLAEIIVLLFPNLMFVLVLFAIFEVKLQIIVGLIFVYIACFILSIAIHHTYVNVGIKLMMHSKEIEALNTQLLQEVRQDHLTQLLNRKGLEEKLEVAWAFCKRTRKNACMVFFDIDFFKNYNDCYGHHEGDIVLQKIANSIKNSFRRDTDIICRLGGEEFLVFLCDFQENDVLQLVQNVREKMKSLQIKPGNPEVAEYLTCSVGIAVLSPGDNDTSGDLFLAADKALYFAKANGRNSVAYNNKIVCI